MPTTGKISYSDEGSSSECIVCLHGIGGDEKSFEPQIKELSKIFRVISWNMPGYNGSLTLEDYSFKNLCLSLDEFLSDLNIKNVTLIGQSIGGMLAQEFYFRNSSKVKALVLIATTSAFGGKDETFRKKFLEKRLKPILEGKRIKELAKSFVPSILSSSASQNVVEHAIKSMEKVPEETYKKVLECLVTFNRYDEFHLIKIPCCLIAGSEDNNSPSKTMLKMSKKLSASEFYNIENTGHLVNLEAPEKTNNIIIDFLKRIK